MEFFYIDYMNDGKKERNIGFLRVEDNGVSVGLRGVPAQCGERCRVYAVNIYDEKVLMGEIPIRAGYGMEKFKWQPRAGFAECVRVEIPLYGTRKGVCILRKSASGNPDRKAGEILVRGESAPTGPGTERVQIVEAQAGPAKEADIPQRERAAVSDNGDLYEEIAEDKWHQLLKLYPQIHICPEAQSILIRPRDVVVLTRRYHELATNSFVLHAYYNYRQLLLFRYMKEPVRYYIGVPGIYYDRERRIAQLFGFEGFENGEARMQQDADRKTYNGCFGYYMKRVEI